ncbi:hypothetical protein [Herpetosiphon giganteus]|uniref:hypothetical protein n=1 Tax=Herpetosiphon giganteus TaxID=2029754 RepID=UPI00195C8308|nr:hypothetical protein [Herpetosiphon giganteus]MBM7844076.1 putative membrane protein [Herpetosiphon giganteus]
MMYQVPKNPQLQRQGPILSICGYNAIVGSFFALASCSYIGTMLIGIAVSLPATLSCGMNAEIFWIALLLLLNASRFGLFIGLLRARRWAYRCIVLVEGITIINMLYELFVGQAPMTIWPLFTIVTGVVAVLILSYLSQPHIQKAIN